MGDIRHYEEFVQKYSGLIYTAIKKRLAGFGITLPQEEIRDIQQDVLVSIWEQKKLAKIRNAGSIPYWIAIVSGNFAMNHMRNKMRTEPKNPISIYDKIRESEIIESMPDLKLNPSEELNRQELSLRIDAAIESLNPKERIIIKLNLLHDKKYSEISAILDIPHGTVANYINRARNKLKKHLMASE